MTHSSIKQGKLQNV